MADYDGRTRMGAIAVAPDGTVWAILDAGLGRFRDGTWDLVVADKLVSLAIAPDGTVWAGTSGGGYVRRLDARTGEARPIFCGWPSSITAAADGSLFIDGTNWGIGHQLWVIRNDSCDRLDPPWVGTNVFVGGLQADPSGGVVMILREPYGPPYNERLVRFEDGRWSVVQAKVPGGDGFPHAVAAVDPAGGAWRVEGDPARIERFDGTQWVEVVPPQGMISRELAMARDGTVWFAGGPGIERLRPAWDDPSAAPTP
jgi:hypothetical protein